MLEFNGHKMFNESNLEWNGEKSIIGKELQKKFVPKVESMENTNQFSKDGTLIEEKFILTQELKLGGHEMHCEVTLEKNDFSIKIMIYKELMDTLNQELQKPALVFHRNYFFFCPLLVNPKNVFERLKPQISSFQ